VAETSASPHIHLPVSAGEGNKGGHHGSLPTYLSTTLYKIPKLSKIVPSLKDQSTLQENKTMTVTVGVRYLPHKAAHRISELNLFLYLRISGVSLCGLVLVGFTLTTEPFRVGSCLMASGLIPSQENPTTEVTVVPLDGEICSNLGSIKGVKEEEDLCFWSVLLAD